VSTPDAILDPRFSDPAATAAGWDETRRALEDAQLSWICTVRADGRCRRDGAGVRGPPG
jgi:hypothetical protein